MLINNINNKNIEDIKTMYIKSLSYAKIDVDVLEAKNRIDNIIPEKTEIVEIDRMKENAENLLKILENNKYDLKLVDIEAFYLTGYLPPNK